MGKKWETFKKFPGFRAYVSQSRKTPEGKPDRCFYIRYKLPSGKLIEEKIGWASEGYTAALAAQIRAERIRTIRLGEMGLETLAMTERYAHLAAEAQRAAVKELEQLVKAVSQSNVVPLKRG